MSCSNFCRGMQLSVFSNISYRQPVQAIKQYEDVSHFSQVAQAHDWLSMEVLHPAQFCVELRSVVQAPGVSASSKAQLQHTEEAACGAFGSHTPSIFVLARTAPDCSNAVHIASRISCLSRISKPL